MKLGIFYLSKIFNNLPTIPMLDIESLRSYITIFLDDSNSFLLSNKNYITPCYMIDNLKLLTKICEENICWVVSERYGIYSKRIYRLLLDKTYLEQKQVSDLSMVPFKETKEILYRMYSDLVVDCNQIIRTPDANPLSSLYLFTVNFNQSISVVLEFAKSVIGKIIDRRIAVMKDIRNLLHKNTKISSEYNIDDLCRSILKSVINNEKVVKYLNELELMELLKLHNSISQLDYSEINVSRVLLVLDKYNNVQINDKTIKK
uniref:DNA-directed RNA polymerase III subunit RPC3 n=1 Tax=Henneguya salminicola TaxID=69463 RepID=A0A6G3MEG3_HENSL